MPNTPIVGGRELMIDGALQRLANLGETLSIGVRYVDRDGGVASERVQARLMVGQENVAEVQGSALLAMNADTDADGYAQIELRAGQGDADFEVELSAQGAASVRVRVTVSRAGGGDLVVGLDAPNEVRGIAQVALYDDPSCASLAAGAAMPFALELPTIDTARMGATTMAHDLADGARYSVFVNIPGVAQGCVDGVEIVGGEETRVTVRVELRPMEFKGRYALEQTIDVRDLIGAESDIVRTVAQVGGGVDGGRGQAIVRLVCEHADLNAVVCTALRAFGGGIIDGIIERDVDPQVLSALTVFGDLYQVLRDLSTYGELEVIAQSGVRLEGNVHRLHGMRFVWRDGCPHDDVDACTFSIGFDEMGIAGPEAVFAANVDGSTFGIEPHSLQIPLDRVAILLAEQWLLPEALGEQGPVTIADLTARLLPCAAIAAQLPGGVLTEGLCEDVLPGALAGLITDQLVEILPANEMITLEGQATIFDAEGDRRTDGLVDGEWTGTRVGEFEACRDGANCD